MASKRKYGYYIKGNKIAIIEEGTGSGVCSLSGYSNQTTCEAAGGTWTENAISTNDGEYRSPVATVSDGLEIQYAYSPTFNLQSTGTGGTDYHKFLGWGSNGSNLLLFTSDSTSGVVDLSSLFAADDWIYISEPSRWTGLHQVKSTGGTTGILTLKTKYNTSSAKITVVGSFDAAADFFLSSETADDLKTAAMVDQGVPSYLFIEDAVDPTNNGFFSISSMNAIKISFDKRYYINEGSVNYTSAATNIADESDDTVTLYNAFYEELTVYEGVEVLEDESFELDLARYQANAVVYYLKAKLAEDMGNLELREFFMREFKRQLEKSTSALKRGPYIIQGLKEMR